MLALGLRYPTGLRTWGSVAVLAISANVVPWTLIGWAQQSIPSGLAAVLYALMPISALLLSGATGQERVTLAKLGALVVALTGTSVAVWPQLGTPDTALAVVAVVAATLLLAVAAVYTKRYLSPVLDPLPLAASQVLVACVACVVSLAAAMATARVPAIEVLMLTVVGASFLLGSLGTGLTCFLHYRLIARTGATNATLVSYLMSVVGLIAGWALLDEVLHLSVWLGLALMLTGIQLGRRDDARQERSPT